MTLLNIFRGYAATLPHDVYASPLTLLQRHASKTQHNSTRSWCDEHFINHKAMERAIEIRSRLSGMLHTFLIKEKNFSGSSLSSSQGLVNESDIVRR